MFPVLTSIQKYVFGGVFAALLLSTLVSGFTARHYYNKYHSLKDAVALSTAIAEVKKTTIETADKVVVNEANINIPTRISVATDRVRTESHSSSNGGVAVTPGGPDEAGEETVVLPYRVYIEDAETCVTNTILLEEWQKFYSSLLLNRSIVNGGKSNTEDRSESSPAGGAVPRSVPGLGGSMDMGVRGDEPVGSPSIPALSRQAPEPEGLPHRLDLATAGEVPPSGTYRIQEATD